MENLMSQESLGQIDKDLIHEASDFVTIAIPTYNRSQMLKISLTSALAQDYKNIRVIVLDDASSDNTEAVVKSFEDERITYIRNDTNVGMLSNWNRAFEINTNPFIVILQDDDILLPTFIRELLQRLEKYPNAALSYALARYIDADGTLGQLQDTSGTPDDPSVIDGQEYLHQVVSVGGWTVHNSAVLLRTSALSDVGFFDSSHAKNNFDFNLFIRLAARFDVVSVPKELVYVRLHPGQMGEAVYRTATGTGPLGYPAERIDALAYLLQLSRAHDPSYRQWLMERLLSLNALQSYYTYSLLPNLYWDWNERLQIAKREVTSLVLPEKAFILVDEDQWATGGYVSGIRAIPFTSRDGVYWGSPTDDEAAIAELEELRRTGLKIIIFGWPAFWWLEHYTKFTAHLYASAQLVQRNSRFLAFELHVPRTSLNVLNVS